ncbi:hypothetical protein [Burkholderia sp. Ac-20365]|uniref:hypothetical protein n=1 Tax=Burkholderia sp. Ac-20365 TaxID=2703897 RepID=UPI00197CA65C|nr:hypothetical protein [Burkholderia sp. Ac-20365]MBN3761284.1 hypothetical protein [Burkholderia sp. Ac-20365]
MRDALLDLAGRSAMYRIALSRDSSERPPSWADRLLSKPDPLLESILGDMCELARHHRHSGEDARNNPLWSLLELQWAYDEAYESGRRVEVTDLSPLAIYECMARSNVLVWQGWEISVGEVHETTDDYGCPAFESRIHVRAPGLVRGREFEGATRATARALYLHMAGCQFEGEDLLGEDEPHPAEGGALSGYQRYADDECEPGGAETAGRRGCGYVCSAKHPAAMEQFRQLAAADRSAWEAAFDVHGRYYDSVSGFWASRAAELRVAETGDWVPAYE